MEINGVDVEIESPEEALLLERVNEARIEAVESGADPQEVSRILSLVAVMTDGDMPSLESDESGPICPTCGEPVDGYDVVEIGSDPVLQPCGHSVPFEELPDELM